MILYRLIGVDDHGVLLPPPSLSPVQRDSFLSSSGESIWSLSSDSKYPSGPPTMRNGLVPYVYDPSVDEQAATDEEDLLHLPDAVDKPTSLLTSRGILNLGVLTLLIGSLLALFIAYPVITYVRNNLHNIFLEENGGNTVTVPPTAFTMPQLIDPETPDSAKTRTGYDKQDYVLVFSDEFNTDGRTFYPGDDPYWEAVDLWYWSTGDLEWYKPRQAYTGNGSLHVRLENVATNGMNYRSGMLQSWNKFCFTSGYIEVALTLPGPNQETRGYVSRTFLCSVDHEYSPTTQWPGAWTMGNLARPGSYAPFSALFTLPFSFNCFLYSFSLVHAHVLVRTIRDLTSPRVVVLPRSIYSKQNITKKVAVV